eukprot:TRINITY_DN841_c0_g1_i1.p1 TRINITY_DN841_c0_g1~~TRINITY_DN841_c0_g1_i1.p1  ORF type:complete len:303 (+),score=4.89 TRINITY_DN841_c0_g1_i1:37-945(+)
MKSVMTRFILEVPAVLAAVLFVLTGSALAGTPRRVPNVPFDRNYVITWGAHHIKLFHGGNKAELLLDKSSGTGFESKQRYMFGHFSMKIKLPGGDSAGVVTAYYLRSLNAEHDEVDFEFLGNRTGQPYILQTNIFTGGKGDREQRIYLWFDPTKDYHTYSVLWNMYQIVVFVDNVPIRVFKNCKDLGVRYPFNQPMKVYSSIWNADDWATRGGLEKTDWSKSPFISSYRGFYIDGCDASQTGSDCPTAGRKWWDQAEFRDLNAREWRYLKWVRRRFTIYNYCTDKTRNKQMPPECVRDRDNM